MRVGEFHLVNRIRQYFEPLVCIRNGSDRFRHVGTLVRRNRRWNKHCRATAGAATLPTGEDRPDVQR